MHKVIHPSPIYRPQEITIIKKARPQSADGPECEAGGGGSLLNQQHLFGDYGISSLHAVEVDAAGEGRGIKAYLVHAC